MSARQVLIDLQDGNGYIDISAYVKYDTFTYTQTAFNDTYKCAQNECSFDVIYEPTLFSALIAQDKDILLRIFDVTEEALITTESSDVLTTEDSIQLLVESNVAVPVFFGHIPATRARTYNGILDNTIFTFSAVDDLDYMNVPIGDIVLTNCAVLDPFNPSASIVNIVGAIAGWDNPVDISLDYIIPTVIPKFAPNSEDDTVLQVLDTLLYEYGYTLNLDSGGRIAPIQWMISETAESVIEFNENNIINEIAVSDNVRQYDCASITYYEIGTAQNIRLYRDNNCKYDDAGVFGGYSILSGYTYPPETNAIDVVTGQKQIVYQEYTDEAIRYKTNYAILNKLDYSYKAFDSDFSAIIATANHYVDRKYDTGITVTTEEFLNKKCRLVYTNSSGTAKNIYYNDVYGDIWYKSTERVTDVASVDNPKKKFSYTMNFVYGQALSHLFAQALMAQYDEGQTSYKFKNSIDVHIGAICNVVLDDGTNKLVLVQSKMWDEKTGIYTYTCKAASRNRTPLIAQNVYSSVSVSNVIDAPKVVSVTTPIIATNAPKYLGKYVDSAPTSPNTNDWYLRYSTSSGDAYRGVFYYDGTAWIRTTDSKFVGSGAINDILSVTSASTAYGTVADYGATYISDLFSRFIKILTGGSIYGGDRFNSAGTEIDVSKDGFYLGADGKLKANLQSLFRSNIVIGSYAGLAMLDATTFSAYNVLVGEQAGNSFTGSSGITAIGDHAGYGRDIDHNNTLIGYGSGYNFLSSSKMGTGNTCVGAASGTYLTTGTYNTLIGYSSGDNCDALTNCSTFGYDAAVTGSNQVQLGNSNTTVYAYGAVQNRSDKRDKADIKPTELGLSFIKELNPVQFRWDYREDYKIRKDDGTVVELKKDGSKKRKRYHSGFIAQDVKKVMDKLGVDFGGYQDHSINGGKDVLSLGYDEFIAPMCKAIQELSTEVDKLKEKQNGKPNN